MPQSIASASKRCYTYGHPPTAACTGGSFFSVRVAVLIDGSNFVNCLARANLGFPALEPFLSLLVGPDELIRARFYYSPLRDPRYRGAWQRFEASQRAVHGLYFWHGHRDVRGREKDVDVGLAVDLVLGASQDQFDRAVFVGGDGDHRYAIQMAGTLKPVLVVLVEGQKASGIRRLAKQTETLHSQGRGVRYRELSGAELVERGICASGAFAPSPLPSAL
jgi:NYN domain